MELTITTTVLLDGVALKPALPEHDLASKVDNSSQAAAAAAPAAFKPFHRKTQGNCAFTGQLTCVCVCVRVCVSHNVYVCVYGNVCVGTHP
jgi:hypothetical protein